MTSIRRPRPGERPVWERLFRDYMAFYGYDEPPETYDRAWREFMSGRRMHAFVAEVDDEVVGSAHYLFHARTTSRDVCYLEDLFVADAFRGRGTARALIEAVAEQARLRDCDRVYWLTQTSNERARRLYDQVGEDRGFMVYSMPL